MSVGKVASRYAKSLIELAEELKVLDKVEQDMELFRTTCEGSRELRMALKSPIILHSKKVAVLEAIFGNKMNELTHNFFKIVSKKSRENVLYEISKEFDTQVLLKRGVLRASLTTATVLESKQKESITSMLARSVGKKIEIEEKIDADLIGGFVIQVDGLQIDSSIKADLIRMRNKFNDSTYINKV